jgi:arsenite methyltransferase
VAGALTERDFVQKLERAGFVEIEVLERTPMGIDDCALYPLFTEELLAIMRDVIPPERLDRIGVCAIIRARLGG